MTTPAMADRIEILTKIRDTKYNLLNLDRYLDHLLDRSNKERSTEDDEAVTEMFAEIAYNIMKAWRGAQEFDKMLREEEGKPQP
jgi:hypothetical protein